MTLCNCTSKNDELYFNATSDGIENNFFLDKYGKRGTSENGMPNLSIPLEIKNAPEGTNSFAILLDDPDAIPVAGFSWTHWLVANLSQPQLKEAATRLDSKEFIEGTNSWGNVGYGGMAPPNAPHKYLVHIYALKMTYL